MAGTVFEAVAGRPRTEIERTGQMSAETEGKIRNLRSSYCDLDSWVARMGTWQGSLADLRGAAMTTIGAAHQVDETAGVPLPAGCNSRAQRNALYLRRGLEFEEWAEIGRRIATIRDSAAWWIGDWLAFGRRFYPGRYKAALAMTGLDYQTLRNYAWVASRFAPSRRDGRVSFGHHAELASLPDYEADAWLTRCAGEHWSRRKLRHELRQAFGASPNHASVAVALAARRDQILRWTTAAETVGTPLDEWIAGALDRAAEAAIAAASPERANLRAALPAPHDLQAVEGAAQS